MPGSIKQPHASACHSYAVRKLALSAASQRRHYDMCPVASSNCMRQHPTWACLPQASGGTMTCPRLQQATACISMPHLCCERIGLSAASQRTHYDTCQVVSSNHMHPHATAKLHESSGCVPQGSVSIMKCARLHQATAFVSTPQLCCEKTGLVYRKPA